MGTFTNSEDPDVMLHNAQCGISSVSTLFFKQKRSLGKNTFFLIIN